MSFPCLASRTNVGPAVDAWFEAWNQTDPGGFARYNRGLIADEVAGMLNGWHATTRLRNRRPDTIPGELGAGLEVSLAALGQFTLLFGSDSAGK